VSNIATLPAGFVVGELELQDGKRGTPSRVPLLAESFLPSRNCTSRNIAHLFFVSNSDKLSPMLRCGPESKYN